MQVTWNQIRALNPCGGALAWGQQHYAARSRVAVSTLVRALLADGQFAWANWLVTQLMTPEQRVRYALYAAEQVLPIFEQRYPTDQRPRNAIKAAQAYLTEQTPANKALARKAAAAAYAAAYAAAAYAAAAAAAAAAAYAAAATKKMREKILKHGLSLFKGEGL